MPPALKALGVLAASAAVAGFAGRALGLPAWSVIAGAGLAAGLGAALAGLERWWSVLLALFPAAVWAGIALDLPPWAWGAAFAVLLLAFRGVHRTRVPLFLSRRDVWDAVAGLLPPAAPGGRRARMVDLGSGLGGLPRYIARRRADCDCTGIELAPLPAWIGALRQRLRPLPNLALRRGDLWQLPLGEVDLAFAFLSPVPMPALYEKARREMRPGSVVVSCEFEVPGVVPDEVLRAPGRPLHVYRF